MKFAIINDKKKEASKGVKGFCPVCGSELIARCGDQRVHHWAHKGKLNCDPWWENETEWHRRWKNHYPEEWQEVVRFNSESGEKHIADIKTDKESVIEFQYSRINPEERKKREIYYRDMAWVVNGTRLKRGYERFNKYLKILKKFKNVDVYSTDSPEKLFPTEWIDSTVPVYFDFELDKNNVVVDSQDSVRSFLCCLLPGRTQGQAVIMKFKRKDFVNFSKSNSLLHYAKSYMSEVAKALKYNAPLEYY